ncbi:MAG TPA: Ran-binding zinc finger domain-containing protein [Polyangia bacterium]|jgi:hypothetical protein|nr:Ran-binding zinc finger domain-containing protein [Polyangia bacterium]
MGNRGLLVAALGASLFAASCKATVEGENKAWDANVQKVNQLAAVYPGFANALHEQEKRAEDAMTAARAVGDKEQQARKMADANAVLNGGFVATLTSLDGRPRQLREKLLTANSDTTVPGGDPAAKVAADDAQRILRNTDDALKAGAPSADAATAVLAKVDGDLQSATTNVDRVITAARQRKQDAAKTAAAASGTTAAPGAAGAPGAVAQVQWKCTYCNHMNADSRQKCEQCGAPRPQPKAIPAPKKK